MVMGSREARILPSSSMPLRCQAGRLKKHWGIERSLIRHLCAMADSATSWWGAMCSFCTPWHPDDVERRDRRGTQRTDFLSALRGLRVDRCGCSLSDGDALFEFLEPVEDHLNLGSGRCSGSALFLRVDEGNKFTAGREVVVPHIG